MQHQMACRQRAMQVVFVRLDLLPENHIAVQRDQLRVTVPVKVDDRIATSTHSLLRRLILRQLHAAKKMRLLRLIIFVEIDVHRRRPDARSVRGSNLDRALRIHPFGRTIRLAKTRSPRPPLPC